MCVQKYRTNLIIKKIEEEEYGGVIYLTGGLVKLIHLISLSKVLH